MQLLQGENKLKLGKPPAQTPAACDDAADAVLNVAPPVVRAIRKMMREHRLPELSVPQFRTLSLLSFSVDASLSAVADYIGSSMPAASRMIDCMVAKNLIVRKQCCHDRRQVSLEVTALGREAFMASRQAARLQLTQELAGLSAKKKDEIVKAMKALGEIFGSDAEVASKASRKSSGQKA